MHAVECTDTFFCNEVYTYFIVYSAYIVEIRFWDLNLSLKTFLHFINCVASDKISLVEEKNCIIK